MTKHLKSMLLIGALALFAALGAPSALAAEACPNEQLRAEDNSTFLPDCRAYELVSPDSNHAVINEEAGGRTSSNGNAMVYPIFDAPENAISGGVLVNEVRAERDPLLGWHGSSLSPPLVGPTTNYISFLPIGLAPDLATTAVFSSQPLDGEPRTAAGYKLYVGQPGGTYRSLMPIPSLSQPQFIAGNADFSHVYFVPFAPELAEDPLGGNSIYSWTASGGLKLADVLPNGEVAPHGASFVGNIIASTSADASRAVFVAEGILYLRTEDQPTVELGSIHIDPTQSDPAISDRAGITSDGSEVLFTSRAELTPDADTGVAEAGRDLYSYDVSTHKLSDLTVDTDPADVDGADVDYVAGASKDGSYIYFTANGKLAPGAVSGSRSLYVFHEGHISFLAASDAFSFEVAGDGSHAVFASSSRLTAYDNTDPVTGRPHTEIYEATVGAGVTCASCRVDGTPPIADSFLPNGSLGETRTISDDGRRVFFGSTDAIVPGVPGGLRAIFEYEQGHVSAISPLSASSNADLLTTSPSGDDVFFKTFENLLPNPKSGPQAVIDARVGGGFPIPPSGCSGVACQAPATAPPSITAPESAIFAGPGNLLTTTPTTAKAVARKKTLKCKKGFVKRRAGSPKKLRCVRIAHKRKHARSDRRARS